MLPSRQRLGSRDAKDKEHAMGETVKNAVAVVGTDIGKNSFNMAGVDRRGAIVLRPRWSRGQVKRAWPICRPV